MKKLLYVCEADSGGIMEYAIRQSAALVNQGVDVHFLCKPSFPVERLEAGIRVEKFVESRVSMGQRRASKKQARGLVGKIGRMINLISDLRAHSKQVAEMAEHFAFSPSPVELTEKDTKEREKRWADLTTEHTKSTEDRFVAKQGSAWASQAGASESDSLASELADSPVSESLNRSTIGSASESSTRHPLPATRHRPGSAEVAILFACYKEYFAPFWVGPLRRLAKRGVVIGTIAHDPIRDFVVGPLWWHRWSVRLAYSFIRYVFVHDDTPVDFGGRRPEGIEVHQIPHGPYEVTEQKIGRLEMRRRLGFSLDLTTTGKAGALEEDQPKVGPKGEGVGTNESKDTEVEGKDLSHGGTANTERAARVARSSLCSKAGFAPSPATSHSPLATPASADVVFLAFGQIRDGKNLGLFLQAMTKLPENVKLLVAGKGDSGSSRPAEYYQNLAEELGVAGRCRWDLREIPDEEVGDMFAACDAVLLIYSAKFRSASGVLNAAVSALKPVLASSGPGPLKTVVNKYRLGIFVEPDNSDEILRGAQILLDSLPARTAQNLDIRHSTLDNCILPAWERYELENSWKENAKKIRDTFAPSH